MNEKYTPGTPVSSIDELSGAGMTLKDAGAETLGDIARIYFDGGAYEDMFGHALTVKDRKILRGILLDREFIGNIRENAREREMYGRVPGDPAVYFECETDLRTVWKPLHDRVFDRKKLIIDRKTDTAKIVYIKDADDGLSGRESGAILGKYKAVPPPESINTFMNGLSGPALERLAGKGIIFDTISCRIRAVFLSGGALEFTTFVPHLDEERLYMEADRIYGGFEQI